jgi:hypothetical protein
MLTEEYRWIGFRSICSITLLVCILIKYFKIYLDLLLVPGNSQAAVITFLLSLETTRLSYHQYMIPETAKQPNLISSSQ